MQRFLISLLEIHSVFFANLLILFSDLIKAAKTVLSEPVYNNQFGVCPNAAREEVMAMERVLLQTIKFDFNIEHPYKFIIQVCSNLVAFS